MTELTHNELRDRIAQGYFNLPPLSCKFCEHKTPLPVKDVSEVAIERRDRNFRADVAALNQQGETIAVIEVVNTNPPSEQVLLAQSTLAGAFYVEMDSLDKDFRGYCSPFCWTNRDEKNVSGWTAPTCSECERPYYMLEFKYELLDWENPYYPVCIECAAKTPRGQWRSPGELAGGDPRDRIPGQDAGVLDLFLSFSDADFWAMVWTSRTAKSQEARSPETETAVRLDEVEAAFERGEWNDGERLLQPIGAPLWYRPPGPTLFAWDHDNCVRTALAWRRLREHRISCLPSSIQVAIRSRPPLEDVVSDVAQIEIIHRGFPDGRFTACGIDRETSSNPVVATMTDIPTCEDCR